MTAVAALQDELRRGMYLFIRQARRPVTRDEAAAAVGISRKLAAFHLDKLVDAGVLTSGYDPAGGARRVGRTPKVYQPSAADIAVSIPPREYDLLAAILLDAVHTENPDENAHQAALRVAHDHGRRLGEEHARDRRPGRLGAERALTRAEALLHGHGFEPHREQPTCLRLLNCPFHALAARSPELVCGINHAFLGGLLVGLGASSVEAVLDPRPGECCVELRAARDASTAAPSTGG